MVACWLCRRTRVRSAKRGTGIHVVVSRMLECTVGFDCLAAVAWVLCRIVPVHRMHHSDRRIIDNRNSSGICGRHRTKGVPVIGQCRIDGAVQYQPARLLRPAWNHTHTSTVQHISRDPPCMRSSPSRRRWTLSILQSGQRRL